MYIVFVFGQVVYLSALIITATQTRLSVAKQVNKATIWAYKRIKKIVLRSTKDKCLVAMYVKQIPYYAEIFIFWEKY